MSGFARLIRQWLVTEPAGRGPTLPIPVVAVGDGLPADTRGGEVPAIAAELVAAFEVSPGKPVPLAACLCPVGVWTIGYGSTRIGGRAV